MTEARFARHWNDLRPPATPTLKWPAICLLGLAAAAWAAAIFMLLAARLVFQYTPYNGVVGPPAFLDYPHQQELFYFAAGLGLAWLLGLGFFRLTSRHRQPVALALLLLLVGLQGIALAAFLVPSAVGELVKELIHSPMTLLQTLVALAFAGWLGRGTESGFNAKHPGSAALDSEIGGRLSPGAGIDSMRAPSPLGSWFDRFGPCLVFLLVLLTAVLPHPLMALLLGLPLAAAYSHLLSPPPGVRQFPHLSVWLERLAWASLLAAPFGVWYLRLARTLDLPRPSENAAIVITLVLLSLPLLAGAWRRHLRHSPALQATCLVPWSVLACIGLGAGVGGSYDAYHQGESIYPPFAQAAGAVPWRDIFYVHGYGINTWTGALMGTPGPLNHSMDRTWYCQFAAVAGAILAAVLLRCWGRRWWPAILAISILAGTASGLTSGRYLPVWLSLGLVTEYLRVGRLRWLALAGMTSWAGLFYSLDTGATCCVAIGLWTLIHGWRLEGSDPQLEASETPRAAPRGSRTSPSLPPRSRISPVAPALAFAMGAGLAALASLTWFLSHGIVADVWQLHLEYLRVKRHYDKIPVTLDTLAYLIAPGLALAGMWASVAILRRRGSRRDGWLPAESGAHKGAKAETSEEIRVECEADTAGADAIPPLGKMSPQSELIPLLTLITILSFTRALDRADYGHLIYASIPAWVLAGALLVWRASERDFSAADGASADPPQSQIRHPRPAVRSFGLIAAMLLLPFADPIVRGRADWMSLLPNAWQIGSYHIENARAPFCGPIREEHALDFFRLCADLKQRLPAGATLYDFSNQPALYPWTGLRCPTRFFAPFYASSLDWQREVINDLEAGPTRWVLWRGGDLYWNAPDEIPNAIRQWRISRHLLRRYRPAAALAGGGLLLERADSLSLPGERADFPDLWIEAHSLRSLPAVWGRAEEAAFPWPQREIFKMWLWITDYGYTWLPLTAEQRRAVHGADELQITFRVPPAGGTCAIGWWPADPDPETAARKSLISFEVKRGWRGPYRIPLSSLPAWVWEAPPEKLEFIIQPVTPGFAAKGLDVSFMAYED